MSNGGLKGQLGVGDPAQVGSDEQSQKFQVAFQGHMSAINTNLEYTAVNAETAKHGPYAARRDALYPKFQGVLGQIDRNNPDKAKGAIGQVLGAAQALSGEVAKFRQDAEKSKTEWDSRQAKFDEAVKQVEELEAWEDPKAPALRGLVDGIRKEVNDRRYAQATKTLDAMLPKLEPIYQEYLKQKAAKEQYEPAREALKLRLEKAHAGQHVKLKPMQDDLAALRADMEAAATKKDFVQALRRVNDLGDKLATYEKALAELEEQKKAFDEVANRVRPRITTASQANYKKLTPAKDEIANLQTKMDSLASEEDYVSALEQANLISSKLDDFEARLKVTEEQKKKYENEKPTLQQKLDEAAKAPHFKKLDSMLQELNTGQGQIDQLAQAEDFDGAFNTAKAIESKADVYLKAVAEADEQKRAFEKVADEKVKPRIEGPNKSSFKTLEPLQAEIKDLNAKKDASANEEDYVAALDQANQVSAKLDEYEKKVGELTAKKQKCEDARKTLQSQIDEIKQVSHPKLAPLVADVDATLKQMDDAILNEDFDTAEKLGEDVKGKIENYHTAEKDLEAKRVAYVPAFSETLTRMEKAKGLCEQFHEKVPDSFESLRGEIENLAKAEEYDDAMKKIEEIKKQLDPLEKKLQELTELKSKCDEAKKSLQPQIDEIKLASHPKLAPLLQEIDRAMKAFDDSMVIQDYQAALKSAGEVPPKIEKYKAAVKEIDAKRQAYSQPSYGVLTKLKEVRAKCAQSNETMPEALEALGAEIVKLEAAEEFDEGMKKIEELKKQLEDFERKRSLTDDASKSDEETQKVRANIARATDRAVSHVDGQGQEVMKAVHAFEKQAEAQIDTVIEDDSDLVNWAGPFITVIGTLVSAVFPPAAGFVAGTAFVASLSVGAAVAGTTAEAGGAKQALRNWIGQYATAVSNALSKGLDAEKLSLPERLNSLARTDKSIWDLLAGSLGNEELDQLMTRLHIPNPAKQSCYGQVLKGLMAEWGSSSAKVKAQHGKTKHQRMIDDNVPSDPSSKDVRKKMGDGRKSGAAQGSQAAKDRQE